jgi:hypothetical protein
MNPSNREKTLTEVLTTRLTPEERGLVEERAKKRKLRIGPMIREDILKPSSIDEGSRIILEETMALRKIVLALQVDAIQGIKPSEQRLKAIVQEAEKQKQSAAEAKFNERK